MISLCSLAVIAIAKNTDAIIVALINSGMTIPDNSSQPTEIILSDTFTIDLVKVKLNSIALTLGLIATLTNVDKNRFIDIFNRPSRTVANALGNAIDFNGNYSFNDACSGDLWATGALPP